MKQILITKLILSLGMALLLLPADQTTAQEKKPDVKVADKNSDGKVTTDELKAYLNEKYVEAWAEKVDANGNGKISKWEFRLLTKALEEILDAENKSGSLANAPKTKEGPESSVDRMNGFYYQQKPKIGSKVKDLVAFNEEGEEVNFEELRGKHVVIVFGCLT